MKFKIFGKDVPINLADLSQTNYDGYFDPESCEIFIHQNSRNLLQVALHEMFHAVWFRNGFNQTSIPIDIQELLVESMAISVEENFEEIKKIARASNKGNGKKNKQLRSKKR